MAVPGNHVRMSTWEPHCVTSAISLDTVEQPLHLSWTCLSSPSHDDKSRMRLEIELSIVRSKHASESMVRMIGLMRRGL